MIRINLLPHRAERRKAQRKHLAIIAGVVLAIAGVVWVAMTYRLPRKRAAIWRIASVPDASASRMVLPV